MRSAPIVEREPGEVYAQQYRYVEGYLGILLGGYEHRYPIERIADRTGQDIERIGAVAHRHVPHGQLPYARLEPTPKRIAHPHAQVDEEGIVLLCAVVGANERFMLEQKRHVLYGNADGDEREQRENVVISPRILHGAYITRAPME